MDAACDLRLRGLLTRLAHPGTEPVLTRCLAAAPEHSAYYAPSICSRKVELCQVREVGLSPSSRPVGAWEARHGMGGGERARGGVGALSRVVESRLALALMREGHADAGGRDVCGAPRPQGLGRNGPRKWMTADGLWLSRWQRRTVQQPRLRRERRGELVRIDGSERRWFEGRGPACTLLVFTDDATSRLMQTRFVPAGSTFAGFEASKGWSRASTAGRWPSARTSARSSVWLGPRQPAATA